MSYIDDIFHRATLHQIQCFLLHGAEGAKNPISSYLEELEQADDQLTAALERLVPDKPLRNAVENEISAVSAVEQTVYFQMGFKIGASLTSELLRRPG